ncbi:hypothetical protein SCOCK_70157 [Actinacidiphila cocklensis]|uniref:Uncharacterized protein n=1 Tax=Actinacidiphila cocklensis TaxID=887465 RepID=A0A9W4GW04_9ACTN|nr:hypothetical protein SCOCK_70157 [Actinacidiphila cocklensis]
MPRKRKSPRSRRVSPEVFRSRLRDSNPGTYALRVRERSCRMAPAAAAWCCSAWSECLPQVEA